MKRLISPIGTKDGRFLWAWGIFNMDLKYKISVGSDLASYLRFKPIGQNVTPQEYHRWFERR